MLGIRHLGREFKNTIGVPTEADISTRPRSVRNRLRRECWSARRPGYRRSNKPLSTAPRPRPDRRLSEINEPTMTPGKIASCDQGHTWKATLELRSPAFLRKGTVSAVCPRTPRSQRPRPSPSVHHYSPYPAGTISSRNCGIDKFLSWVLLCEHRRKGSGCGCSFWHRP
jgi:hypothetical protein